MGKFLKHIESGSFHEVDDDKAVLAAYPGQFEAAKSGEGSGASKAKRGFGDPKVGKWADGTEADTTVAAAPATPVQTGVGELSNAKVEVAKASVPDATALKAPVVSPKAPAAK